MPNETTHLGVRIARSAPEVYAYAADPAHLPDWAPGLGRAVEEVDGRWFVETDLGRVEISFAPRNDLGVLDHDVTLPSGEVVHNPARVLPDGDGCEVLFTVRRRPGMSHEEFAADASAVAEDLERLRQILEGRA